jgi:alginate O-acetyltransferase complex protein AlgJ
MMESGIGPGGLWALIVLRKPQGDNRAAPLPEMIATPSRYLSLFIFLLLATPLLAGFIMPESGQEILKEARTRAPAPSLPRDMDEVAAWPKEADAYLGDRFGLRNHMIRLHANLAKRWLGEGGEAVLVGRRGRLFFLGEDSVRQSAGLIRRDSGATETADFVAAMRDALSQRGIRFLVASPPNATTIYQDDLPSWARSNGRTTEYDILLADLAARGIKTVDLRPVVRAVRSDAPAYFLYDTHWTPRAAIAGFNAIAEADGHREWRIDPDATLAPWTEHQGGDLARLIGVNDDVVEPAQELTLPAGSKVELTTETFPTYVATGDQPGGTIMIIGDSFTQHYFAPMLLKYVGRVVWLHHKWCGFDWKLIDRFQPDEVWWTPTERYLLCNPNVRPDGFPSAQQAVIR